MSGGRSVLGGEQVEGRQAVRELLRARSRRTLEVVLARGSEPAPVIDEILASARARQVPVLEVGRAELDSMARTGSTQGVLARAEPLTGVDLGDLARPDPNDPAGAAPFLLALDGITDPGNLGAILRIAEGAGVTGIVLPRHRAVRVTPTVTKAAAGAVEHMAVALVPGLPAALRKLSAAGVWTIGLDPAGPTPIHDLTVACEPLVLVLGSEGVGLSRLVAERCDVLASIPLRGRLASLNVAAAGAVACFEITRCRTGFDPGSSSRPAPGS